MNDQDRITQLEAACAAMREALKAVSEEIGGMASLLMESEEQEDSTLGQAWRALIKQTVIPALRSTAGKSLLERLQAVEAERDEAKEKVKQLEAALREATELLRDSNRVLVDITIPEWLERRDSFLKGKL